MLGFTTKSKVKKLELELKRCRQRYTKLRGENSEKLYKLHAEYQENIAIYQKREAQFIEIINKLNEVVIPLTETN